MRVAPAPRAAAWLRWLEVVLLAVAVGSLSWVARSHIAAARDQANWAEELETQLSAASAAAASPETVRSAPESNKSAQPAAVRGVIGRLELPRLQLSAMTREGTDAATLRRAVGHVPRTALPGEPGNAAFAGHRDTFFRKLRDVKRGDDILITTARGRHRYVVRETRVVQPTDVSVLDPTDSAVLTLVTCYPFNYIGPAPERFIVRAELVTAAAE
jgi:sortase A